jgi:molecular chaperone HtpG
MTYSNDPIVGANTFESLTTGMYNNPKFIFREYVQNSADGINELIKENVSKNTDEGKISIIINEIERTIEIIDNGVGISNENFSRLLDIGVSSKKRGENMGFRGIGRLGGIGYCDKLVFESKSRKDTLSKKLTWDCKKLKSLFYNGEKLNITDLIKSSTKIETVESNIDFQSYFSVKLLGVAHSLNFFDSENVIKYCQESLPIGFSRGFIFKNKIYDFISENNLIPLQEFKIELEYIAIERENSTKVSLLKSYRSYTKSNNKSIDIKDVSFLKIYNKSNDLMAWGWYGIRNKYESITKLDNPERGLRVRMKNIQIGEDDNLLKLWKDPRFHWYFVGEIHCIDNNLTPNARRDNFVENDAFLIFSKELQNIFLEYEKLCRIASQYNTLIKGKEVINEHKKDYFEKEKIGWINEEQEKELRETINNEIQKFEKKKQEAVRKVEKCDEIIQYAVESIQKEAFEPSDNVDEPEEKKYISKSLSKLSREEKKIIEKVFIYLNEIVVDKALLNQYIQYLTNKFK